MDVEYAAWLGSWLSVSSIALVLSTTMAALWCACIPRGRARVRYAVWSAALALAIVAPLAARSRAVFVDSSADAGNGALVLPLIAPTVIAVWAAGLLVMLARIVYQQAVLWRWSRRFVEHDATIARAMSEALNTRSTGTGRRYSLVKGDAGAMPVCWGVFRPRIMLPADAVAWTRELKRVVLRHELAHIEQHDALSDLLSRLIVAVFWFHPAAWLVFARIRVEREQACDERVVDSGVDPVVYGEQLLALARSLRPINATVAAVSNRRTVETRIAALLVVDGRHRAIGVRAAIAGAVALIATPVLLLTPQQPSHRATRSASIGREAIQLPGGHPGSFRATLTGPTR